MFKRAAIGCVIIMVISEEESFKGVCRANRVIGEMQGVVG